LISRLFMLKYIYYIKRFIEYIKGTGTHMKNPAQTGSDWKIDDFRWILLSNSSEGGTVVIFKWGSRKEKFLGSVTISTPNYWHLIFKAPFFYFLNQFRPDRKWLYPFQCLKSRRSDIRWIFLSNSSEGDPVGTFKCGSRNVSNLELNIF
jgi:hypothetical protein